MSIVVIFITEDYYPTDAHVFETMEEATEFVYSDMEWRGLTLSYDFGVSPVTNTRQICTMGDTMRKCYIIMLAE